jgi:predicted metal-dependent phosphoesterase TrpH
MYTDYNGVQWYKGNLHTHTVLSDGLLPYGEVVARYRHAGYDFLAVTDHWVPSKTEVFPDFLLLSGCEYDLYPTQVYHGVQREACVHINGVGFAAPPEVHPHPGLTAQAVVDAIHRQGGLAIFNHPDWSRNLPEDLWAAQGYDGVEIYNAAAEWDFLKQGYSGVFVDQVAQGGCMLPVMAADDAHGFMGDEFGGFILVQAKALTLEALLRAIRERKFIATQGPWVQAWVEGDTLRVTCTPVRNIRAVTDQPGGRAVGGQHLTGARFTLPERARYVRVEVTDGQGLSAWTIPVALGGR